jgi:hypothetical protein
VEWAFHSAYPFLDAPLGGTAAEEKEKFFPPNGKNWDIYFRG